MKFKFVKPAAISWVLCLAVIGCSEDSANNTSSTALSGQGTLQLLCEITKPAELKGHEQLYIINLLGSGKATIIARVLDFPFEGEVSNEKITGKRTDTVGDARMTETIVLDRGAGILHRTLEKQAAGNNTLSQHYSKCAPLADD